MNNSIRGNIGAPEEVLTWHIANPLALYTVSVVALQPTTLLNLLYLFGYYKDVSKSGIEMYSYDLLELDYLVLEKTSY